MNVQNNDVPLVLQLDDVAPEDQDGIERKVMFSPTTVGSSYMKFTVAKGRAGARMQSFQGAEMVLTLQGNAHLAAAGACYELTTDSAIAVPPGVAYSMEVVGDETWIAVTVSCDECPLMLEKIVREVSATALKSPETSGAPLLRQLAEVVPEQLYGFERRVLFSPATVGSDYLKFAKVRGKPGAKSVPHTHLGGEMALTLHGNAELHANGEHYKMSAGTAIAVPPAVKHPAEAIGSEEWIVVTSYCDECPLLRKKLNKGRPRSAPNA